ncbi:uncharacterized protein BJ171DRAFT_492332 [Polychytrium aggregatum]|uniref:uncharacterized protein n=1 Tax=Polychytrium aggregatum TaxID=110093 RepID=UPI0022FF1436|nr:uncharacterized protein BJ171DRAFT_492332 [Polychytrium aggregatum]KAI9208001.1 hypothetical protein BJ171DRAFT_492332 [Polychytrium aggregatum]
MKALGRCPRVRHIKSFIARNLCWDEASCGPDGTSSEPIARRLPSGLLAKSSSVMSLPWGTEKESSTHLLFHNALQTARATAPSLFDVYFTLSAAPDDSESPSLDQQIFYTSDIVHGTMNPQWDAVDPLEISVHGFQQTKFLFQIWAREKTAKEFRLLISFSVELDNLQLVGENLSAVESDPTPNSVYFWIDQGYYSCRTVSEASEESFDKSFFKVDSHKMRTSYNMEGVLRLLSIQKELWNIRCQTHELLEDGEEWASHQEARGRKIAEYRDQKSKVQYLEGEIMDCTQETQAGHVRIQEAKERMEEQRRRISLLKDRESQGYSEIEACKAERNVRLGENYKLIYAVTKRQKELIRDLSSIYPIKPAAQPMLYTIGGILLPNSEYTGANEMQIATALGYAAHLVMMIAFYLELPLRYSIKPMSSRSTIVDPVSSSLGPHPEQYEFPLFTKGVERVHFDYAVYLLNKNVEQLLNFINIQVPSKQLRNTLPNLQILMDEIANINIDDLEFFGQTSLPAASGPSQSRPKGSVGALADPSDTESAYNSDSSDNDEDDGYYASGEYSDAASALMPTASLENPALSLYASLDQYESETGETVHASKGKGRAAT